MLLLAKELDLHKLEAIVQAYAWCKKKGRWKGIVRSSVALNNTKIRIAVFLYPSTLVSAGNNNEQLIMVVLFNNGKRWFLANAALAFVADCNDVDSVHGLRKRRRAFRRALAALRACGLSLLLGGLPLLCW